MSRLTVFLFPIFFCAAAISSEPGAQLALTVWKDHRGAEVNVGSWKQGPTVVVFMGTECPLVKMYSQRLADLEQQYSAQGLRVVGVMSNAQDSLSDISAFIKAQSVSFPVVVDPGAKIADQFKAERTPEVFLLDKQHQVQYRGRIDDQYAVGGARKTPDAHELRDAIDAVLANKPVLNNRTEATGCIIGRPKKPQANAKVTYHGQIAAIFHNRCVSCHREGDVAPSAMTQYEEVHGWAEMIGEVVAQGRMPPWHADPKYGEFANNHSLSSEEKEMIQAWVASGAPQGDTSLKLPEQQFVSGWQLPREPDLVLDITPQPIEIAAEGEVKYQYFRVDPKLLEDRWVVGAELQPGNRAVVHHILAFTREKGLGGGLEADRGFFTGYVPGLRLETWRPGYAKHLKANSEFIFQVHYTPVGTPQQDQSRLGLIFCDAASVTHEVKTASALQHRLRIPPGEANYKVNSQPSKPFPEGAELLALAPHMHVRGKSFRYELVKPDGARETLLNVPQYDFNWQHTYYLKNPLSLIAGSHIVCSAMFDNSAENPYNPDPKAWVTWGDQTSDEMMIGYFHYAVPVNASQKMTAENQANPQQALKKLVRKVALNRVLEQFDANGDGSLQRSEVPEKHQQVFSQLDTDKDQVVSREELEHLPLK